MSRSRVFRILCCCSDVGSPCAFGGGGSCKGVFKRLDWVMPTSGEEEGFRPMSIIITFRLLGDCDMMLDFV